MSKPKSGMIERELAKALLAGANSNIVGFGDDGRENVILVFLACKSFRKMAKEVLGFSLEYKVTGPAKGN